MPEECQRLVDERAIEQQLVRFARAMDDRDWPTLASIMFDDITADVGTGPLSGSAAFIECMQGFLDACGPTQHLLGNILVDVDGDVASSRAYVSDIHLGAGERSGLTFSTLGDYHDSWKRDGRGWRLRHRTKLNRGQVGTMAVFGLPDPGTTSEREILNLVYSYPELIDAGDFVGVGALFSHGTLVFEDPDGSVIAEASGAQEVAATFDSVKVFADDGTPHTRHVVTNPILEIDEAAGTATCRYYITVFQRSESFPLQPVWANRYEDEFRRVEGVWRMHRRRGFGHLPGDTSEHLATMPDL